MKKCKSTAQKAMRSGQSGRIFCILCIKLPIYAYFSMLIHQFLHKSVFFYIFFQNTLDIPRILWYNGYIIITIKGNDRRIVTLWLRLQRAAGSCEAVLHLG